MISPIGVPKRESRPCSPSAVWVVLVATVNSFFELTVSSFRTQSRRSAKSADRSYLSTYPELAMAIVITSSENS